MNGSFRALLIGVAVVAMLTLSTAEPDIYLGADLSYVNEMEDCGAVYRVDGEPHDPFTLFADHGATLVRARLWHTPDWTDYSDLADVTRTFQRATDTGMATLLSIHYSDDWADPGRQDIPAAWATFADNDARMAQAVYDYTYDTLATLHYEGLLPTFVQIGNETNAGMLLRDGEALDWSRQARLFNAGIRAVRDFAAATDTQPRIVLHIAQPENAAWWFREAEAAGITDFDVIGLSYYPQWSDLTVTEVGDEIASLRQRFNKDVMIVETAYPWTLDYADDTATNLLSAGVDGYAISPQGQLAFLTDLTQSVVDGGGIGVIYWEPAWVSTDCRTRWGQGSHWENATFFDFRDGNNLLPAIGFLTHDYKTDQADDS